MKKHWLLVGPTETELQAALEEIGCIHETDLYRDEREMADVVRHGGMSIVFDDIYQTGSYAFIGNPQAANAIIDVCDALLEEITYMADAR